MGFQGLGFQGLGFRVSGFRVPTSAKRRLLRLFFEGLLQREGVGWGGVEEWSGVEWSGAKNLKFQANFKVMP